MLILKNNIIPIKGFCALNFFGVILFVRNTCIVDDILLNHENIHSKQYKELYYIGFLVLYFYFWIKNIINKSKYPYNYIPFEMEANDNETNLSYLKTRNKYAWKNYC